MRGGEPERDELADATQSIPHMRGGEPYMLVNGHLDL